MATKKDTLRFMKCLNPKEFWEKLKLKHKGNPFDFDKLDLFNYFKHLSGNENGDESESAYSTIEGNSNLQSTDMFDVEFLTILDRVISIDEIGKVIVKLKNGKAAGLDKIIPELLKSFDDNFLSLVTSILNKIFDSGKFPDEWVLGVIVILFKEGTKSDLNNYRSITLLSMLGKILVGVLNNRLWEVWIQNN